MMIDAGFATFMVAIAAVLSALVGVAGGLLGGSLEARRAESRAAADRIRMHQFRRLRTTQRELLALLDALEATVLGRPDDILDAQRRIPPRGNGNIYLLGDAQIVRDYQAMAAELRDRLGKGLDPDYRIRSAELEHRLLAALDAQEDRVARGEKLAEIPADVAASLPDARELAAMLRLPVENSTWMGRLAAWQFNRNVPPPGPR